MHASLRLSGVVLLAGLALAGCKKLAEPFEPSPGHGRYAGIGIYAPGAGWTKMTAAQQTKTTPAAQPIDDNAIIVVVDSITGEVRSCGNMTGYCIGMNPWKVQFAAGQIAPVPLTEHAKAQEPLQAEPAPADSAAPAESPSR